MTKSKKKPSAKKPKNRMLDTGKRRGSNLVTK